MRISEYAIRQLVKTVDENELANMDCSPLLNIGFTRKEICSVHDLVKELRHQPYLTEKELLRQGITDKKILVMLGGIDSLKKQLNIEDYFFPDWLNSINHKEGDNLCLPYWIYQRFYPDIANQHIQLLRLKEWIKIEVNGIQMREFVLPNKTKALIPASDRQAAELLIDIWTDRNELVSYDEKHSVLIFLNIESGNKFPIEVRCQSSEFTSRLKFGFCIEDDQQNSHLLKVDKTITAYELIEKINEVDRKAAENF